MNINIRGVDPSIHRGFKTIAAAEGTTITDLIKRFMAEYVDQGGRLPEAKPDPPGEVKR